MRDLTHEPADVVAAERSRVATEGWGARLLALQAPDGLWGGNAVVAGPDGHVPRPGAPAAAGARSRERAGPAGHRPRPRARHLGGRRPVEPALGRQPVLRGRGRAVHQRQRRLDRRVLRRGHDAARRPASRRAAPGRRLELRGRERRDGVVVRDDDQRPRGPARARAGDRRLGRGGGGPPPRRGVHARAPAVPPEVDRRGDRPRAGSSSRSRPGGTTTSCAGSTTCATPGSTPDERVAEAIEVVEGNRDPDGRWPLQNVHEGEAHFQMEDGEGKPSRWNTLRAMRVLDWYARGGAR